MKTVKNTVYQKIIDGIQRDIHYNSISDYVYNTVLDNIHSSSTNRILFTVYDTTRLEILK
jgi:hypothetical protein